MNQKAKLTTEDKKKLYRVAIKRWRRFSLQIVLTYLLPIVCIFCILFFLNFLELYSANSSRTNYKRLIGHYVYPRTLEEVYVYSSLTIPIYFIITIANAVSVFQFILPIHYDLIRGKKKLRLFHPIPYTTNLTNDYFIKTNLPEIQFIQIDYETYYSTDYSHEMCLELSLTTNTILSLKTSDGNNINHFSIQ